MSPFIIKCIVWFIICLIYTSLISLGIFMMIEGFIIYKGFYYHHMISYIYQLYLYKKNIMKHKDNLRTVIEIIKFLDLSKTVTQSYIKFILYHMIIENAYMWVISICTIYLLHLCTFKTPIF